MALGMKARLALTARHLANKQRKYRWQRTGDCVVRWESRRRMWPAPEDYWDPSPVHMCSAVAGDLVVVVVSLVWAAGSTEHIGPQVEVMCLSCDFIINKRSFGSTWMSLPSRTLGGGDNE